MKYEPKVCSRCQELKDHKSFRVYKNRRVYSLRPACKECEVKIRKQEYARYAESPEWREKRLESTRRWRRENRDEYLERQRIAYHENNGHRSWRNDYRASNKDRINEAQRRVSKNRVASVTQGYVIQILRQNTPLAYKEIPPALIKLKRLQIQCKRIIKSISHEPQATPRQSI